MLIVGHHKGGGGDTKQKVYRNFGYAKPEGYRKALRAMKLAEKFKRPVIAFIDTPAAYPGMESEERGISEAIAFNLREMAALDTPIVIVVHGEGGGGALGIAIGDRILMHEFAIYSVIPPEGCAAILWRDSNRKVDAAQALKLTSPDLLRFGIIDQIVREPSGGAHTNHDLAARLLDEPLSRALGEVSAMNPADRLEARYRKFRVMGNIGIKESREPSESGKPVGATKPTRTSSHASWACRRLRRLLCIRGLGDLDGARRFAPLARRSARSVSTGRHGARCGPHPDGDRTTRASRNPWRLRCRWRHVHCDSAPGIGAARRRRRALHSRTPARRLRVTAGGSRTAARRRRARLAISVDCGIRADEAARHAGFSGWT